MPKKSTFKGRKNLLITGVWGVIIIIVLGYGLSRNQTMLSSQSGSSAVDQISDEGVTWLSEPQQITIREKLFEENVDWGADITYYKLGEDNGKDIIIAQVPFNGPGDPAKIFMVHDGTTYTILPEYSYSVFNDGLYTGPPHTNKVNENGYKIYHALSAPDNLVLPEGSLYHPDQYLTPLFFRDFEKKEENKVKQLREFTNTPWGPLYRYTVQPDFPDNPAFNPPLEQFVLKLADGEAKTYQIRPQFIADDNVLLGTWNDGTKNKDAFTWNMTNGGCGASGFVEVLNEKEASDLTSIGKTANGEPIYGFKNSKNPTLRGHYEYLPNGAYYFYDAPTGESKQTPITVEEYNQKRGVVVHKDSFGRYVVLVNQTYGTGAECGKPVIYLYPPKTTTVDVRVGARVTKSEPLYNTGWTVTAQPNGELTMDDGKKYTSLFWEGTGYGMYPSIQSGFIVSQEEVEETLWSHLEKLGLNTTEASEFMEFWMSRIPHTPYVRLTWFGTRQMDELAPLTITPKPDTSIRIFLDFEGLEKPIDLPVQTLSAPARKGFTVVEWGGLLRASE